MSLNILNVLGELSNATDQFIEGSEKLHLEEWFNYVKEKALDIQRNVQPTTSTAIPNCLTFIKGSSTGQFRARVSSVFPLLEKDHLHEKDTAKNNIYDKAQMLDDNHTCILPDTTKLSLLNSSANKTYTAIKGLELNQTGVNYSVDEVKSCISQTKHGMDGSSLSAEQESSKPLFAANNKLESVVRNDPLDHEPNEIFVVPDTIKESEETISTNTTFVIEKEEAANACIKKTASAKQNKRKQSEISEGSEKYEKNQVKSLSCKRKKDNEKNQIKSLSYKRKNADNSMKDLGKISKLKMTATSLGSKKTSSALEKKGKANLSLKKVNASSKSKHLKSVLQSKGNCTLKAAPSLTKNVVLSPGKENIKLTKETNDKVECSEMNKTFVSTVTKIVSDEIKTPEMENDCKRNISIQTDASQCSPMMSGNASANYKMPSIPPALSESKQTSIAFSQTSVNTSEKNSNASVRSEDSTDRTSAVSYDISEIKISDDDEEADKTIVKKHIPSWAKGVSLKNALFYQHYHPLNTDDLFGKRYLPVDLEAMFGVQKKRYCKRTSSAIWHSPSSFKEKT